MSDVRAKWEEGAFAVANASGELRLSLSGRYGWFWANWGIHRVSGRWYRVVHLPSGRSLAEFDRLRCARRFCEAVNGLTDWSRQQPGDDDDLKLAVHRAAMRVTGARPVLRLIDGGGAA